MRFDGKKLKAHRVQRGWSLRKAASELYRETEVEVTGAAWANWEKGANVPGSNMLPALATLFDVEMAEFFSAGCGHDDTTPQGNAPESVAA